MIADSNPPIEVLCMACVDETCDFKPMRFQRRPLGKFDVQIDMKYCGICHTDLHIATGHLKSIGVSGYPCVPGHELSGVCVAVGSAVEKIKVGDHVGVGCMVDSCFECGACKRGEEQKCSKQVGTYCAPSTPRSATFPPGGHTLGGYTSAFVVHERFAIKIPKSYPLEYAGPIMCSGVTLYSPMRDFGAKEGTRIAIIGLGGLGTIGIKIAKHLGCYVTAVSRSEGKSAFAKQCGADAYIAVSSAEQMKKAAGSFDLVLNTIPVEHDYTVYSSLINRSGKQVILGLNTGLVAGLIADSIVCGGSRISGSAIGSIECTQAVIDICADGKIFPEIKVVPVEDINGVYETLASSNDSGLRYVIDIAGSLNEDAFERCKAAPPVLGAPPDAIGGGAILCALCSLFCCCRCCI